MKIAISATGKELNSEVDPRFGRCQYLILVDLETMQFEVIDNANTTASSGVGIATAQLIASKGIEAVLTGNCGPNAYDVLAAAGIKVITGVMGKVEDAIQEYKSGNLEAVSQANVAPNFGMSGSTGAGMGQGMGPGMGPGMGQGMGLGMGKGRRRGMGPGMGRGMGRRM